MKKLSFLPLLLVAGFSQAQITLSQADFASVGDTVFMATDQTLPGINVGTAGASAQTWNFTSLNIEDFDSLLFVAPGSAVGGADFPSANIAMVTGATSTFFIKSASNVKVLGSGGAAQGFGFSAPFNPPYNILTFPTTLGTTINETSGFDVTEFIGIDTTVFGMNVQLDSLRFKRDLESDITFDAHGTIGLPVGSFQALRAYSEQTVNDSIYAFMGAPLPAFGLDAGWNTIDQSTLTAISALAPELFTGQTIGITVTRSYDWYAQGKDYRLASIQINDVDQPVKAEYISHPSLLASVNESEVLPTAFVYPNPTTEFLQLSGVAAGTQGNLTVLDMNGKTVMNARYNGQNQISVSGLGTGTYFFNLVDKQGKLLFSDKFQVVK